MNRMSGNELLVAPFRTQKSVFEPLQSKSLLITGGTGFFGKWLLLAIAFANSEWKMGIKAISLSRQPSAFLKGHGEFASLQGVEFIAGDVRSFDARGRKFDLAIHAATDTHLKPGQTQDDSELASIIVGGARQILRVAKESSAQRILFVSSGAVYGQASPGQAFFSESMECQPHTQYGKSKLEAEKLFIEEPSLACPIARCFAFAGPYLPLDAHFAIGNFVRDAVAGNEIVIKGDGSPMRSYMHAADLVVWLLKILMAGEHGRPVNVGSDEAVSIKTLAGMAARLAGRGEELVKILGKPAPGGAANIYVPDISRAKSELGLSLSFSLEDSLRSMIAWARSPQ